MRNGDWSQMGLVGGGMRLDKEDGELKSNPVSDGGVGGTFGPRADPETIDVHRRNAKELAHRLAYSGAEAGGVASVDELLIVLRYIPMGLLGAYLRLIDRSVGERALGSGRGYSTDVIPGVGKKTTGRIKTSSAEASIGGKKNREGKSPEFIRSEAALGYRSKVDRKLRKIAREINYYLATPIDGTAASVQRRCAGSCKRLGDGEWLYCPWCAGPMEETENRKAKK